jgi:hypothetical protein
MDIGDIRPIEVIDEQDDECQVYTPLNFIINANQASSSSTMQDQQVASTSSQPNDQPSSSNQVQVLQPTIIARDHPIDQIVSDIRSGVQTR